MSAEVEAQDQQISIETLKTVEVRLLSPSSTIVLHNGLYEENSPESTRTQL
jgi:hypothetical protein